MRPLSSWRQRVPSVQSLLHRASMLVAVAGLLASSLAAWSTWSLLHKEQHNLRQAQAQDLARLVEHQLKAHADALYHLRSSFNATEYVNWREFDRMVTALDLPQRYPAFDDASYLLEVQDYRRSRLEQSLQHEDYWRTAGRDFLKLDTPRERERYDIVFFVAPLQDQDKRRIGRDVGADPAYAAILSEAKRNNSLRLAHRAQSDVLDLLLPVYKVSPIPTTAEERSNAVLGTLVFSLDLQKALVDVLPSAGQIPFALANTTNAQTPKPFLFQSPQFAQARQRQGAQAASIQKVDFAGQHWQIHVYPNGKAGLPPLLAGGLLFLVGCVLSMVLTLWVEWWQRRQTRQWANRFRVIFDESRDPYLLLDLDLKILDCNPATLRLLGLNSKQELLGLSAEAFSPALQAHGKSMADLLQQALSTCRQGHEALQQRWVISQNGRRITVEASLKPMQVDGRSLLLERWHDLTEQLEAEARILHMAMHDELTGLPNRSHFQERFQAMLYRAKKEQNSLSLFFIDLDRFKHVNDTLGHGAGDEVLKIFSLRLQRSFTDPMFISRFGGDEFVMLVSGADAGMSITRVAEQLVVLASQPILLAREEYQLSASVGIASYPEDGDSPEALLKHADIAMYRAKSMGRNAYQYFAAGLKQEKDNKLVIERQLRQAIDKQQLELFYQPRAEQDGRWLAAEALLRWRHPERGLVPPLDFIPLAEETDLIVHLGRWVLNAACIQGEVWRQAGQGMRISVNLSARQFMNPHLVQEVAYALSHSGFPPSLLELELTESLVMHNPEQAIRVLRELKSMGITLAIDDFGTGYSSLAYLKRLPIDYLKIDRSFVMGLPENEEDAAIARAVMAMADSLHLQVVAEGVETQAQADFLSGLGCQELQGFGICRPMPADKLPLERGAHSTQTLSTSSAT